MQLIFIYGAPAVGKYTVARELGRLTGFAVFDNHLSVDCVRPVFGFGSPHIRPLVEQIRHLVIGEAARQDISLIFTFAYSHPQDDEYVQRICDLVEDGAGTVHFVRLTCDPAVQEQRVAAEDRQGRKIGNPDLLRGSKGRDFISLIPGRDSLTLDTTDLSAEDAARQIAAAFDIALL